MKDRTSPLFILVAIVTAIAALYLAKAILLPIAMAILLTFLLTPLADRLEGWHIPRVVAVLLIVGVSFLAFGSLVGVVTQQLVQLGTDLPKHELELKRKIRELKPDSPTLQRASRTISNLRNAILQSAATAHDKQSREADAVRPPAETAPPAPPATAEVPANTTKPGDASPPVAATPVAVEVVKSTFTTAQEFLVQLAAPLGTAALVIVLVLFMLLDRESQRSRVVQLFGRAHMHQTAEAVHDVSRRVGRYLRTLFLLNAGYGVVVFFGLWLIGVPGAVMWGVLGFTLRFLPYIGPWIAATLPIMVSIATSPGWTQPLLVVGWYVIIELLSNNIVEPLAYGSTTGVSTVGVIIAAIFWTWLWGPIGLILAMPMTVCLLVAARYVPQLKFITILLADEPPQSPHEQVYQRLLAFDYREPLKLANAHLKDSSVVNYYDTVLLPALMMAEQDRHADLLNDDQSTFILEATEDIIDELGESVQRETAEATSLSADGSVAMDGEAPRAPAPSARVLCIPLRDDADELAARMLVQLLKAQDFDADFGAAESLTSELVDRVAESESNIVVISILPPIGQRDSRLLWRRLRTRYPHLPIVVGFWTAEAEKSTLAEPVDDTASRVVTTLSEAIAVVRSLAAQQGAVAKTG